MSQQHSLLIVDDNPSTHQLLIDRLMRESLRVYVVEDGRLALERALQIQPSLILLDIMMPDIDGFAICEALKEHADTRDIPLIFLTALTQPDDIMRGFASGAVDFVTKPVNEVTLAARIQSHIKLYHEQRRLEDAYQQLANKANATATQTAEGVPSRAQVDQLIALASNQNTQLRLLMKQLIQSNSSGDANLGEAIGTLVHNGLGILRAQTEHAAALSRDTSVSTAQLTGALDAMEAQIETMSTDLTQLAALLQSNSAAADSAELDQLSAREIEILKLIADGYSTAYISNVLTISDSSVRTYKSRILQKLNLKNITALVKFAIRHGLTSV